MSTDNPWRELRRTLAVVVAALVGLATLAGIHLDGEPSTAIELVDGPASRDAVARPGGAPSTVAGQELVNDGVEQPCGNTVEASTSPATGSTVTSVTADGSSADQEPVPDRPSTRESGPGRSRFVVDEPDAFATPDNAPGGAEPAPTSTTTTAPTTSTSTTAPPTTTTTTTPATTTTTTAPPSSGGRLAPAPARSSNGSLVQWSRCDSIAELTDQELDVWASRGTAAWVCMVGLMPGLGSSRRWSDQPSPPSGSAYELQRQIVESRLVERMGEREMDIYLGFYLTNYFNKQTPLSHWMRPGEWNTRTLPALREVSGAANAMGMAGMAFDEELYAQQGNVHEADWRWNVVNTETTKWSQAEVRAAVQQRGREMMEVMLDEFPGLSIIDYGPRMPDTWGELVQKEVNDIDRAYFGNVHRYMWAGLTSLDGWGHVYFMDAHFYKGTHLKTTFKTALEYNANRHYALFSRTFPNWDYAAERVHVTPFAWVGEGATQWEKAYSPEYVREQLMAYYELQHGGLFANYLWGGVNRFDYTDYEQAFRDAKARRGVYDTTAPTISVGQASASSITGTVDDDRTIRAVHWSRGSQQGAADMTWASTGDYERGYDWHMTFEIDLPSGSGPVTLTVVDGDGNRTSTTVG